MTRRAILVSLAVVALAGIAAARFAPYIYAESWPLLNDPATVMSPEPARIAKGRMADDYFAVEDLGHGVYAIGEPRYYQANYSYLIVGDKRALLFDAGSGTRDMRPVVKGLTDRPVTILPSHLHYDHLAGIKDGDRVAIVDLPATRADADGNRFRPGRYQFLGMFDGLETPAFEVAEWIKPGATIDLGGRTLRLLSTPGHTPQSVSLYDAAGGRLFTGDYIYPTMLYAFLPGANRGEYRRTAQRLLKELPPETRLWAAHCCRREEGYAAPWLTMKDLADLDRALGGIDAGTLKGEGFFPKRYRVNDQMDIGTTLPWIGS
ncbi:Glyoxylase, beta-lactamase superfamily II [Sphingopyxis sp. YR583]|uniref:MBL fold metallo-hydrolase n=1 Tax=Sphingopyxis sp. YR583 TaxID=1881047 RepID=UPI0008A81548|nr:MBL fold metallo-hydrolase [Sphingopyxis sp. YR583]SEH13862.1 Glyoxylase, beta-lactamase superfamily II [Sphingopyxis sp. YR583]